MVGLLIGPPDQRAPATDPPQDASASGRAQPSLPAFPWSAVWRTVSGSAVAGAWVARSWAAAWGRRVSAEDLAERLVAKPFTDDWPTSGTWLHAASLGEVQALAPLARALADLGPTPLFVTTSTASGRARASASLRLPARLAPLDSPGPLHRFLERTHPQLHVIVETEIWPLRIAWLAARDVPVVLVSGRLSPARWPRYRRLGRLYRDVLSHFSLVCPASEGDRDRFLALGLDSGKLGPCGNLKWDASPAAASREEAQAVLADLGIDPERPWLVLGSVHPGEVNPLIQALAATPDLPSGWGILIAPRHPQRFDAVAEESGQCGLPVHKTSSGPPPAGARLVLIDQLGLLSRVYPAARAAFLGGTLVPVGGHSPLEAAAAGCPLATGPFSSQQEDLCGPLREEGALIQGSSAQEVGLALAAWLNNPSAASLAGQAGRRAVDTRRGHAVRLASILRDLLP